MFAQCLTHLWSTIPLGIICSVKVLTVCDIRQCISFDSLRPSDAIWWHRTVSTLAQMMACCLMAPRKYLNQYWLIISQIMYHSHETDFTLSVHATSLYEFQSHTFEITATFSRGQWVNENGRSWHMICEILKLETVKKSITFSDFNDMFLWW